MMRVPELADRIDIRVTETANLDHEIVQKNASRYWPQFGQAINTYFTVAGSSFDQKPKRTKVLRPRQRLACLALSTRSFPMDRTISSLAES